MTMTPDPTPHLRLLEALQEYDVLLRDLKYKCDVVRAVAGTTGPAAAAALERAITEVEQCRGAISAFESYHEVAREGVAADLGVEGHEVTVALLVRRAPREFRAQYAATGAALERLASQINRVSAESQLLIADALRVLHDSMRSATGRPTSMTYDRSGRSTPTGGSTVAGQL
jgi:hypothetical protein